jgi:hypothetical protein
MLISTALLLDSIIRNSVCTPAKLPCRRVEVGYSIVRIIIIVSDLFSANNCYFVFVEFELTLSNKDNIIIIIYYSFCFI